ncbi:MAG: hypothetical protein ACP5E8_00600 [Thermoplasmata archaeon]
MKGDINEAYLSSLLRLEVKNYDLTPIPSTFYKDVRNYLEDLKGKIDIETTKKNSRLAGKYIMDLENSEKNFRRIVERRISKILMAKSLEEKERVEGHLTPEEQIFYESLSETIKNFLEELLHGGIITNPEIPAIKNESKKETVTDEPSTKKNEGEEYALVYIKQDIQNISIMGEKINLRKEDILTLPVKYADVIDKQGLGKKLKII